MERGLHQSADKNKTRSIFRRATLTPKPSTPHEDAPDSLPDTKQLEAVTDRAIAVSGGKRVTQ